jgi:hypothetical protein
MKTKTLESSSTAVLDGQNLPVIEPRRGTCVEFVEYCKEEYLKARAAQTFLRMFHNKSWEAECERIRKTMRPEVDHLFAPTEKALSDGANCKEALDVLLQSMKQAEKDY